MMNTDRNKAKLGTHGFTAGACAPTRTTQNYKTFSVGIFQWVAKEASHQGVRKSAAQVRVAGSTSDPEAVYAKARAIVAELDAGTYRGPTRVEA